VLGIVLLAGFLVVESRAAEPILPLSLFRIRNVTVSNAVGFIVGLSLFGSVTYMPLYLQVVRGHSPTGSGLLMTPLMAGVLVTSIGSGQLISRFGRYKVFPITGTALTVVGMLLLSTLDVSTTAARVSAYMVVLGLGLGMVMQVLVLVVQNAVDYSLLGVATSTATLFRSVGGSIGVAMFGAIFANRLAISLAENLPRGTRLPAAADPATVDRLPPRVHAPFVQSFVDALHPVFLAAAGIAFVGFVLAWFLKEIPLRRTVQTSEGVGESFAMPREATSLREMERIVSNLARRENRWRFYERLGKESGVNLSADEYWLLGRLGEGRRPHAGDGLAPALQGLEARGLVDDGRLTDAGRGQYERLVAARRQVLADLFAGWDPDEHEELRALLARFAAELEAEPPRR
jgi:MFS family permease